MGGNAPRKSVEDPSSTSGAQPRPQLRTAEDLQYGFGQSVRVVGRHRNGGFAARPDHFGQRPTGGGNERSAARHRLNGGDREPFVQRGDHHHLSFVVELHDAVIRNAGFERHDIVEIEPRQQLGEDRPLALLADDRDLDRMLGANFGQSLKERSEAFQRNVGRGRGHDAMRRPGDVSEWPETFVVNANGNHMELLDADTHLRHNVAFRRLRYGNNPGNLFGHFHLHSEKSVPTHE